MKKDLNNLDQRMSEVRENIKNLGLEVSEEQLEELMGKVSDKIS